MHIAIDAFYTEHSARTVGVLFRSWSDPRPQRIITADTGRPCEYAPGRFYRRELPCIQNLLGQVDLARIQTIVIDGYVYLDDSKKPGLGHYVYTSYEGRIPVIGVAKNPFRDNEAYVKRVYRGASARPLYYYLRRHGPGRCGSMHSAHARGTPVSPSAQAAGRQDKREKHGRGRL